MPGVGPSVGLRRGASHRGNWRHPGRCGLQLAIKRLDGRGRYETVITRDDGVIYWLRGVGHDFAIPHDLAHYVIERALGLDDGFWGTIADGAVFPTMHYRSGRRAPKAAARSHALLAANVRKLIDAEVLVRLFNDSLERGDDCRSAKQRAAVDEALASFEGRQRAVDQQTISRIHDDYAHVLGMWMSTKVGCELELRWARPGRCDSGDGAKTHHFAIEGSR